MCELGRLDLFGSAADGMFDVTSSHLDVLVESAFATHRIVGQVMRTKESPYAAA